jgi:hypothetical protein
MRPGRESVSFAVNAVEGSKGATPAGSLLVARGDKMEPLGDAAAPQGSSLRKDAFQTPSLFDYARGRDVSLGSKQ